jgi:hypothetical protein
MAERTRVHVWCEDREHETFARRLLELSGVNLRKSTFTTAPRGKGSAAGWVIARGVEIRAELRATRNQAELGFLVIVDGDNQGIDERKRQLRAGDPSDSRLAILVPTWSIETWALWLAGEAVDESRSHAQDVDPSRFRQLLKPAMQAWNAHPRPGEEISVPSLAEGRRTFKQLLEG